MDIGKSRLGENRAPLLDIGAGETNDDGYLDRLLLQCLHDALGNPVAAVDAGEDVQHHRLDVWVREHDAEGVGDLLRRGAAADVEEIGRAAAVQRDRVHRRHRQAGAVDDAADVTVQRDVVQAVAGGLDLFRVFLVEVAVGGDFRVAVHRVAVYETPTSRAVYWASE